MPQHSSPDRPTPAPAAAGAPHRLAWSRPELAELPRLVKLTLQTGGAGGGAAIPGSGSEGSGLIF